MGRHARHAVDGAQAVAYGAYAPAAGWGPRVGGHGRHGRACARGRPVPRVSRTYAKAPPVPRVGRRGPRSGSGICSARCRRSASGSSTARDGAPAQAVGGGARGFDSARGGLPDRVAAERGPGGGDVPRGAVRASRVHAVGRRLVRRALPAGLLAALAGAGDAARRAPAARAQRRRGGRPVRAAGRARLRAGRGACRGGVVRAGDLRGAAVGACRVRPGSRGRPAGAGGAATRTSPDGGRAGVVDERREPGRGRVPGAGRACGRAGEPTPVGCGARGGGAGADRALHGGLPGRRLGAVRAVGVLAGRRRGARDRAAGPAAGGRAAPAHGGGAALGGVAVRGGARRLLPAADAGGQQRGAPGRARGDAAGGGSAVGAAAARTGAAGAGAAVLAARDADQRRLGTGRGPVGERVLLRAARHGAARAGRRDAAAGRGAADGRALGVGLRAGAGLGWRGVDSVGARLGAPAGHALRGALLQLAADRGVLSGVARGKRDLLRRAAGRAPGLLRRQRRVA